MIHQPSNAGYRAENVSLQISNETIFNFTLNDENNWNKIVLASNISSNHINLTAKSKYGGGKWVEFLEIKVFGCHIGKLFYYMILH